MFNQNLCVALMMTLMLVLTGSAKTATVNKPPQTVVIQQGQSITLRAASTNGFTYQWLLNGFEIVNATKDFYVVSTPGIYQVMSFNSNSCVSELSDPVTVILVPALPIIASSQPNCSAPGSSRITNYIASHTYRFNPAGPSVGPAGLIDGMVIGTSYTVTASYSNSSSVVSAPFSNLPASTVPTAPTISGSATQPDCSLKTGSLLLSNLPAGEWTINPGAIKGNTATVLIKDLKPGVYNFSVTNSLGCQSPASANVVIVDPPCIACEIEHPIKIFNAVSPGVVDGMNDFFYIQGIDHVDCYPTNKVEIYNRWGVLVFERSQYRNDISTGFVGISEGRVTVQKREKLPAGTYYYILAYSDKNGKRKNLTGYLELKWN